MSRYKSYTPPYTIPEIIQLRSEGKTLSQIADHFGRSATRIGHLLKRERERQSAAERSAAIQNEIRSTNDIGRKLPLPDLFCVLNLSNRATAVLRRHFRSKDITEFSLRDMMDFLLPVVGSGAEFIDYLPAFRIKTMGTICYSETVKGLSAVDGGEMFQQEWGERKKRLREYSVRTGGTLHKRGRWKEALA